MFEGKTVLIAGAGDGDMLPFLRCRNVDAYGFDKSDMYVDDHIAYGDIMNPNIMTEMESKFDVTFDLVITENLLQVLEDPEIAISNLEGYEKIHITYRDELMHLDPEAFWVIDT